jgi:hypothetical protein
MKIAVSLSAAAGLTMLATLAASQTGEDTELGDSSDIRNEIPAQNDMLYSRRRAARARHNIGTNLHVVRDNKSTGQRFNSSAFTVRA